MAGKRRAESSKEQTEEESARVGTTVVCADDRRVQGNEQRGNTGAMHAALRKLGRRGHREIVGTTITSDRFKACFEKLTGERFKNLSPVSGESSSREEIAVNEAMDILQEPLAMEANDLLNEEPYEEKIIREMKNLKELNSGKGQRWAKSSYVDFKIKSPK